MPTGLTWQNPPERAWPELAEAYRQAIERGIYAIAQRWAPEIENWMVANRPWTDRTGNARATLHVAVEPPTLAAVRGMVELVLAHGMDYGFYLEGWDPIHNREMQNAGQWAIIAPALDQFGPRIWADVVRMLS